MASPGKRCSEQLNKKKTWSHLPEIQMSLPLDAEKQSLVMSFFFFLINKTVKHTVENCLISHKEIRPLHKDDFQIMIHTS